MALAQSAQEETREFSSMRTLASTIVTEMENVKEQHAFATRITLEDGANTKDVLWALSFAR
jgi:hypothetical protein